MIEMQTASTVSVGLFHSLKLYAGQHGVDFSAAAQDAGLELSLLEDVEARIPGRIFLEVWAAVVRQSQDPHPGLHIGLEMGRHYPGGNILFTLMMNCPDIGRALEIFLRYHRIQTDAIQPTLIKDGDRLRLSWNLLAPGFSPRPQVSEALLCTLHAIMERLSGGRLHPLEVCFTHAGPEDASEYQDIFRAPLHFEAGRNELVLPIEALDFRIQLANPELFKVLERYAAQLADQIGADKEWAPKVLRLVGDMFAKGLTPDVVAVSKALAVSQRSLQQKLNAEGTTFRDCLDGVRKRIALDYLKRSDVTIIDVTFLLGYSEQSAFNHAFKRWTGKTPRQYCSE